MLNARPEKTNNFVSLILCNQFEAQLTRVFAASADLRESIVYTSLHLVNSQIE